MPPRYAYWTILIDGKPTAFRARERDELVPTFQQLKRTSTDVVFRWFARGQLWDSPEQAQWARKNLPPTDEKRGQDWRPGGQHKDPRDRFKKRAKATRDHFERRARPNAGGNFRPGGAGEQRPWRDKPAGPPRERKPWSNKPPGAAPRGDRPWRPKPAGGGERRPWRDKPTGPPRERKPWSSKPPGAVPRGDRPWRPKPGGAGEQRPWRDKPTGPPRERKPWSNKPPGAAPRGEGPGGFKKPESWQTRKPKPPEHK